MFARVLSLAVAVALCAPLALLLIAPAGQMLA